MTKTVRVRVAVAVCSTGEWFASGYSGWNDVEAMADAERDVRRLDVRTHWLEADLPIPEPQVIEAEVKPA